MNGLLRRLTTASMTGAALAALAAGCTSSPAEDDGESPALDPYPASALGCFGEDHMGPSPGLWGQCCAEVSCYTPDDGVCAEDIFDIFAVLPGLPSGSGDCGCTPESTGESMSGPYAPVAPDEGSCCYVFGTIGCDGRPLLVEGAARVARIRQRLDWLA